MWILYLVSIASILSSCLTADYESTFYGLDDLNDDWQYDPSTSYDGQQSQQGMVSRFPSYADLQTTQAQYSSGSCPVSSDADMMLMEQPSQVSDYEVSTSTACVLNQQPDFISWKDNASSSSGSIDEIVYGRPPKKSKHVVADDTTSMPGKQSGRGLRDERRKDIASALHNAGWFNTASREDRTSMVNNMRPLWGFPKTPLGFLHATAQVVGSITPQHAQILLDPQHQKNIALIRHIAYETRPQLGPELEIPAQAIKRYLLSSIDIPESRADAYILAALKYEGMARKPLPEVVQHIVKKIRWPKQFEDQQIEIFKSLQRRTRGR